MKGISSALMKILTNDGIKGMTDMNGFSEGFVVKKGENVMNIFGGESGKGGGRTGGAGGVKRNHLMPVK